jgi:hypothetical protein
VRETNTVLDDGWKRVWAEMTDAELKIGCSCICGYRATQSTHMPTGYPNSFRKRNGAENLKWRKGPCEGRDDARRDALVDSRLHFFQHFFPRGGRAAWRRQRYPNMVPITM